MKRYPNGEQITRARDLRRTSTDAERKLWQALKGRQLGGHKFRRQARIGPFIADFLCHEARVIIEADGSQHAERVDEDQSRTAFLEAQGYRVLRFWNHEILTDLDGVLHTIYGALVRTSPSPSRAPHGPLPLPSRERDI